MQSWGVFLTLERARKRERSDGQHFEALVWMEVYSNSAIRHLILVFLAKLSGIYVVMFENDDACINQSLVAFPLPMECLSISLVVVLHFQ